MYRNNRNINLLLKNKAQNLSESQIFYICQKLAIKWVCFNIFDTWVRSSIISNCQLTSVTKQRHVAEEKGHIVTLFFFLGQVDARHFVKKK